MGLFGGGNSSSTSNNYDYNTYNTNDNRQALGEGAVGASGGSVVTYAPTDARSVSTTTTDPGALRAMETAMLSNAAASKQAIESASATAAAAAAAARQASQDAITSATTTQRQALDFATGANATNAEGFSKLLSSTVGIFDTSAGMIREATTDAFNLVDATNAGLKGAYEQSVAEKAGTIDNKTIMILGIAAAAALVMMKRG